MNAGRQGKQWRSDPSCSADAAEIVRGKFDLDLAGHYARPDVFQLRVNEAAQRAVTVESLEPSEK